MEVENKKEEVKKNIFGDDDIQNHQYDDIHAKDKIQICYFDWFNIDSLISWITAEDVGLQDERKTKFVLFESVMLYSFYFITYFLIYFSLSFLTFVYIVLLMYYTIL